MKLSLARAGARLACIALVALAACSPDDGTGPDLTGNENPDATVFVAQNEPPQAVMDALYQGTVNRDEQGCLRVNGEGGATVIWPYGFRLVAHAGGLYVKHPAGRIIGRIGGDFRMGGGFVPSASYAHLSAADRALLESRCPSTYYWVVGETD
jgi:hypothetical protein